MGPNPFVANDGPIPLPQPQNGRANVPDLLIILGEFHAQTRDEIQTLPDEGCHSGHDPAAFSGLADGCIADAGDDCHLLAGDAMWFHQL